MGTTRDLFLLEMKNIRQTTRKIILCHVIEQRMSVYWGQLTNNYIGDRNSTQMNENEVAIQTLSHQFVMKLW